MSTFHSKKAFYTYTLINNYICDLLYYLFMVVEDLVGEFSVIGSNQNEGENEYKGTLSIILDSNNRIIANWLIGKEQKQTGYGFFNDNILVINFQYLDDDEYVYKGVVVYRCLNKDILDGFWSEELGDPKFLGYERCFRIQEDSQTNC